MMRKGSSKIQYQYQSPAVTAADLITNLLPEQLLILLQYQNQIQSPNLFLARLRIWRT